MAPRKFPNHPLIAIIITVVAVFQLIPDTRALKCPSDWTHYSSDVCVKGFQIAESFAKANEICKTEGASLASVSDPVMRNVVWTTTFNNSNPYWVTAQNYSRVSDVKGVVKKREWPLEVPFDHLGEGGRCVKMKNNDGGFEREECNVILPYYCETYVGNQMVCPNDWKLYFRENSCIGFFGFSKTYHMASIKCFSIGASLVKIWNKEKEHFVTDLTPSWPQAAWVGIEKSKGQMKFKFSDGKDLVILKPKSWTIGDVAGGRDDAQCMVMGKYVRGLEKRNCDEKYFYFCVKAAGNTSPWLTNILANGCLSSWEKIPGGDVCVKELKESLTFERARQSCWDLSGDLPTIQTQAWLEFIRENVRTDNKTEYWIFNNDLDADGMWGGKYKFPPTPNIPDNPRFDNCVNILANTGQMKRVGCDTRLFYICERDMDINFECPESWTPYLRDHTCFRRMNDQPKPYMEARALCKTFHRDLVTIDTDHKKMAVQNATQFQYRHFPQWVGYYNDPGWSFLIFALNLFSWKMPMKLVSFEDNSFECVLADWEPNTYRGGNCYTRHYYVCEKHEPTGHRYACDRGWTMYLREKVCVKVMDHQRVSFFDAVQECKALGGRLAQVWNAEKNYFIKEIYPALLSNIRQSVWIEMMKISGKFVTFDGTRITPIYPGNKGWSDVEVLNTMYSNSESTAYQTCLTIGHQDAGIVQSSCETEHYPICEKPLIEGYQGCFGPWSLFANESTCIQVFRDKKTWFEAFILCAGNQGSLVEISSFEKLNFISKLRGTKYIDPHWIGMRDTDNDGAFEYLSGFKFFALAPASRPWKSPFEPIDKNVCLRVDGLTKGYVARHCDAKYFFICQKNE